MRNILLLIIGLAYCVSCAPSKEKSTEATKETTNKPYSVWMADSEMDRNPEAWMIDFVSKPKWGYVQGLVSMAILQVWKETGDQKYFDYVKNGYADELIDSTGSIIGYKMEDFNIDKINSGKMLFTLYEETGDERYRKVIEILREQLSKHPRVSEGGFWHKKIYTNQMWLDGLYMGTPFYAQYITDYGDSANFDDVTNQFLLIDKYLKDQETGLYYHGWDETKNVFWADPETGLSKNFWGRGIGWYHMALVDVLEILPKDHKDRDELIQIYQKLTDALINVQQDDSGVWYQVLDMPDREGNYLESTCATMFVYAMVKGMELELISDEYQSSAMKGYNGILKTFIEVDESGNINLTSGCSGAGLGPAGNLKRDGTFEYYMSEEVRSNDGKGVGPFIMTSIMIENNPTLSQMVKRP